MALIAIRNNYTNKNERPRFPKMEVVDAAFLYQPNFMGETRKHDGWVENREGRRYFNLILEGDNLQRAMEENWFVQKKEAWVSEDGREFPERYYVQIGIDDREGRAPKIFVVKGNKIKAVYENLEDAICRRLDGERLVNVRLFLYASPSWSDKYDCWRTYANLDKIYVEFKEEDITCGGFYEQDDIPEELPFN